MATCTLGRNGIKFTVEESKIFQANAFLQEQLFQEYNWNQQNEHEQFRFRVHLPHLLECLNIFGSGPGGQYTALQLLYSGYGRPLVLMYVIIFPLLYLLIIYRLEEGGVVTECALQTLEAEDLLDVNFRGSAIPNKVVIDVC